MKRVFATTKKNPDSLKDWLVLDRRSGRLVIVSDHDNRAEAMWSMFCNLTCAYKGGFCFVNQKEQIHAIRA